MRQTELEAILARLDGGFPQNEYVRLVGDDLSISPVRGEDPSTSAEQLRDQVVTRLPKVDLPDLLIEVDRWTGFSRSVQHAGGAEPRSRDLVTHLHAAIFAHACNFGLDQMAELAGLSYRKLAWCATWYLREDTLKAAIAQVVNFQHRQRLAQPWGSGTLSSSDGQRFPVTVKARHATALPRYYSYGRGSRTTPGLRISMYGGKPIPSTERDATYVLNAIIAWNTVYMAEALDLLRADGFDVDDDDLVHIPPTLWAHVNIYGKYEFAVEAGTRRTGLRPLRQPAEA